MLMEILEKLFPPDTPENVRKRIREYVKKNPDKSEGEVLEMFGPSLRRANKAAKEKAEKASEKLSMDTAAAKRKITQAEGKAKKAQMMRGGMANGKVHMYATGGSVTENPGLKALKASGPKGREAYNKITGKNA